jgi:hypothetical protein
VIKNVNVHRLYLYEGLHLAPEPVVVLIPLGLGNDSLYLRCVSTQPRGSRRVDAGGTGPGVCFFVDLSTGAARL